MNLLYIKLLTCLLVFSCCALASDALQVAKRVDAEFNETSYGIKSDSCFIEWVIRDPAPEESKGFAIRERLETSLSPAELIPYRRALLQQVRSDRGGLTRLKAFTWGRLRGGHGNELYTERLARLIENSRHWNKKKARLVRYPQGLGAFLEDLLNREDIFQEVRKAFEEEGIRLRVIDVEEVIIGTIEEGGRIGFRKSEKDKFPVDFMFTFEASRTSS